MIIILGPNIHFNLFFSNNDIDILIFNMNKNMIYSNKFKLANCQFKN